LRSGPAHPSKTARSALSGDAEGQLGTSMIDTIKPARA
jgi:hypothetical protein